MTDAADPPPPPDPHAAAAIARAERRLAILAELTEIGMALARDLGPQVADPPAPEKAAPRRDPADAFARLSRAIRLTLALEARTEAELAALRAGVAIAMQARREAAAKARSAAHRGAIELAVQEAIETEIADPDEGRAACEALTERLREDPAYEDLDSMTFTEAVRRLCADLDLSPDWSRWTEQDWLDGPHELRRPYSPFCKPSRRPVLIDPG
jgi:hypothetical protein